MERFTRIIDFINDWAGKIISPLILAMMAVGTYEVAARYFFNSPTSWAWEINDHLLCLFLSMAGGYTLLLSRHVSVDIIYGRLSPRTKAILDLVTWPIFFLVCIVVIWQGSLEAWDSTLKREYIISSFRSPAYPDRWMIPVGTFLLLLQGIARYLRDIMTVVDKGKSVT